MSFWRQGEALLEWMATDAGSAALAGAAGGLVRWMTLRERPLDGAAAVLVGGICAVYLGPLAEPMVAPVVGAISRGDDGAGLASFVVGLGGIGLAGVLIDATRRWRGAQGAQGEQG